MPAGELMDHAGSAGIPRCTTSVPVRGELAWLRLVAEGLSSTEIAEMVGRSVRMTDCAVKNAVQKRGARDRLQGVAIALTQK